MAGRVGTANSQATLDSLRALAEELGVTLAPEKAKGPTTVLTCFGIELDTF